MAARDRPPEPWALLGAHVWTGAGGSARAISFDDHGRVLAVGSERAVCASLPAGARRVAARGLTVVPGFVDAHTHVRSAAGARIWADCSAVREPAELLESVARAARSTPGAAVSLAGLDIGGLGALPKRAELDRLVPDRPLRVRDRSLHGWLLNTPAADLVAAELGRRPEDGIVPDRGGEVRRAFGQVTAPDEFEAAVRAWSAERLREGVTSLLDAGAGNAAGDLRGLGAWRRSGALAQHTVALVGEGSGAVAPDPDVAVAGTKLVFAAEPRDAGSARRRLLAAWAERPLAAVHCADVEALGDVLAAVEELPPRRRRQLRIEHASVVPPEWVPRVAASGARVVTQPAFVHAHGDRYRRAFPAPFRPWLYRQRAWVEAGVGFAAGSDEPSGPGSPLLAWRAGGARPTAAGAVLGGEEALGPDEALAALTAWAADACGLSQLGRLLPGKRGCAAVLSGDPLGPGGPGGARTVLTVLDGHPLPGTEPALDVD
jgi:predicted amidohydrolase YtcJ